MRSGADTQVGVGWLNAELVVVNSVQIIVVVLTGVDSDDRTDCRERLTQHASLNHLRPCTKKERERSGHL